jgi:hypothetical protein
MLGVLLWHTIGAIDVDAIAATSWKFPAEHDLAIHKPHHAKHPVVRCCPLLEIELWVFVAGEDVVFL